MNAHIAITKTKSQANRRGAMLPLIAFLLPVLLIFLGFAVDLAYMQNTRMELRAATDAAARAGATELSRTEDIAAARIKALNVAEANSVAGAPLKLAPSDVEVGRALPDSNGKWVFTPNGTPPNSVRVNGRRNQGSLSGTIPLFFGRIVGSQDFEPVQLATASFLNVDICLVLDRSSSMKLRDDSNESGMYLSDSRFCSAPYSNSRWVALDGAIRIFTQALRDTDADEKVALVTYSSDLSYYNPPLCGAYSDPSKLDSTLHTNLSRIEGKMDDYRDGVWNGNTYIEAGMRTALTELQHPTRSRDFADKIMIVLTDGHQNEGDALDAANDCSDAGVIVHAITFSSFADQNTMRNVANAAGGRHYHAHDGIALGDVFRELAAQIARLTE
ncbi:VWA domain-containing protein [Adhaeretor mobilis]|uniref:von Willebrand factor type A domain protein n=1 Tax=Adhaeretor mobilis TaxID=1930276 RepID=A0A517MTE7_9BACT|nr:VWA domain-containing protein [Adhaeretor mobilis]QDS98132.1 von Willebrand factor type A domain protein [Adhaeretor mobilis]